MDNVRRPVVGALLVALSFLHSACIHINIPPPPAPLEEHQVSGSGKDKILLVDVSGMISSEDKESFYTYPSMIATIKEELTRASRDESVKALVLRINTPGGTVTASDIIHHELKLFKASRKIPVIASIMDVGASGGYYIASAADRILAHPSTVTGSIGVIMLTVNAHGLLEKVGVEATAITSGPRKDMGSPFRVMTPEERDFSGADRFILSAVFIGRAGRPAESPDGADQEAGRRAHLHRRSGESRGTG
jgi:protease-4